MHITLERTALLRTLDHVRGVVEKKATIPILSNILMETDGGYVKITATDLDLEVSEKIEAGVLKSGVCTVPGHLLREIVAKLPLGSQVNFEFDAEKHQAAVKSGRSSFKLATLPREDFPVMAADGLNTTFTMPAATLATMIAKVKTCMSTEETRYYLNGFLLEATDKSLRVVATDGHRLTRYDAELPEGAAGMKQAIVPRRPAAEIHRLLSDSEGDVEVSLSESKIVLTFGGIVVKSKLIDANYPPYERVIPLGNANVLEVDVAEFAATLNRVCVVLTERTALVKLSLASLNFTLSARDANSSADATDDVAAEYNGTPMEIGFNSRYLSDFLAGIDTPSARISFGDPASPAIIEPMGEENSLHLLMPLRV